MYDTLLYHKNCPDGITAAWVVLNQTKHLKQKIEIIPCTYSDCPPDLTNKSVAIVDLSFPRPIMEQIILQAKHVLVLDHHESVEKELESLKAPNLELVFDMTRCGAKIAWDYFYKDQPTPWFISYVQDRDLWEWKLPNSKEIFECMWQEHWYTFEKLDQLYVNVLNNIWEKDIEYAIKEGGSMVMFKNREVKKQVERSILCTFQTPKKTYIVRAVDCSYELNSDVGNSIVDTYDDCEFAIVWVYRLKTDEWWCSLRCNNQINLAEIASQFLGRGHRKAARITIRNGDHLKNYLKAIP